MEKERVIDLSNSKNNLKRGYRRQFKNNRKHKVDRFSDVVPLDPKRLSNYDAGASRFNPSNAKTKVMVKRFENKRNLFIERSERTARTEILNKNDVGKIESDELPSVLITQREICDSIGVSSASKHFSLNLKFGPYTIDYTENGRHILVGGKRGHIAAFDWMTKDLKSEINVMESVRDVQWLHVETMYSVAQKRWVKIYDNQGVEIHCIKSMFDIKRMEFLPQHFLLVASGGDSWLHYLDISIGKIVSAFSTGRGSLDVMTKNPANAIILLGDSRGRINMWSPNSRQPLVEMLAHKSPVKSIAVDPSGLYMATTGLDRQMRIWDLRTYKELYSYGTKNLNYEHVTFSQEKLLAATSGSLVQIFKDTHLGAPSSLYMTHHCGGMISNLQFCPYEDILGVGHSEGFESLIIPGSGAANFDGLRSNPFESTKQRQEREVKMLLEKIQPELITLDPRDINKINKKSLSGTLDYKQKIMRIKPTEIIDY